MDLQRQMEEVKAKKDANAKRLKDEEDRLE